MEGLEALLKEDEDEPLVTEMIPAKATETKPLPITPKVETPAPQATSPTPPAPTPAAPKPPVSPPAPAPVAVPPAAVATPVPIPPTPAANPPAVAPAVQPTAPVVPPAPVKTPEQEQAEWAERRKGFITQLVNQYKVPEDKVALLEAEPATYLPELAAQLHANILEAAVNGIMAEMPRMWAGYQAAEQRYAANERAFYTKWPELQKPEYGQVVASFAQTFRQLNPKATEQQVIDQVGIMAMTHLGLSGQPAAVPVGVPPVVPSSPVPIVPGGGAPQLPQAQTPNPWELLSQEDMD